jgi:methionyl-tRNA synthetase
MNVLEQQARSFFLQCRARAALIKPQHTARRSLQLHSSRPFSQCPHRCRDASEKAEASPTKTHYTTTPIFYVNAAPHAGHLYSMVLADVIKRWQALIEGRDTQLLTGTDEHGIKVQRAAELAGVNTYDFCTQNAEEFQHLADTANVSYTRFFRTTDSDHKDAVRHFWRELNREGYVYEAKHEGWYCVSDETFYPESKVHLALDPATGIKRQVSMETGKEVVWTSETNYHFRLSAFRQPLLDYYKANPDFVRPSARYNSVIKEVEAGLTDLSISRPKERLSWGIPVPDDPSQTIYVWFDALINYLTHTGYPNQTSASIWPADVQIIGKDILRFHTIYWPAFLLAAKLPLPKTFVCHAHWTMNQQKMSKSLGNVVNPFMAMNRYGVDTIRYFMMRDGPTDDDAPYENMYIVKSYKSDLQRILGNLLSRTLHFKHINAGDAIESCQNELAAHGRDELLRLKQETTDRCFQRLFEARGLQYSRYHKAHRAMQHFRTRIACAEIIDMLREANKMFEHAEPWNKATSDDPELQREARWTLYIAAETLRTAMTLLQPFMPSKMKEGLDMLGVDPAYRARTTVHIENWTPIPNLGRPLYNEGKPSGRTALFPALLSED